VRLGRWFASSHLRILYSSVHTPSRRSQGGAWCACERLRKHERHTSPHQLSCHATPPPSHPDSPSLYPVPVPSNIRHTSARRHVSRTSSHAATSRSSAESDPALLERRTRHASLTRRAEHSPTFTSHAHPNPSCERHRACSARAVSRRSQMCSLPPLLCENPHVTRVAAPREAARSCPASLAPRPCNHPCNSPERRHASLHCQRCTAHAAREGPFERGQSPHRLWCGGRGREKVGGRAVGRPTLEHSLPLTQPCATYLMHRGLVSAAAAAHVAAQYL
jgi:hypothetical protein